MLWVIYLKCSIILFIYLFCHVIIFFNNPFLFQVHVVFLYLSTYIFFKSCLRQLYVMSSFRSCKIMLRNKLVFSYLPLCLFVLMLLIQLLCTWRIVSFLVSYDEEENDYLLFSCIFHHSQMRKQVLQIIPSLIQSSRKSYSIQRSATSAPRASFLTNPFDFQR